MSMDTKYIKREAWKLGITPDQIAPAYMEASSEVIRQSHEGSVSLELTERWEALSDLMIESEQSVAMTRIMLKLQGVPVYEEKDINKNDNSIKPKKVHNNENNYTI